MSLLDEVSNFTSNIKEPATAKQEESLSRSNSSRYVAKSGKKSEKFLETLSNMGYDLTDMLPVFNTEGNQLVVSCAGSGKTTLLVLNIIYSYMTKRLVYFEEINGNKVPRLKKVWVSTFLRSGADDLEAELSKWCRKLGISDISKRIRFSTIHAEFLRVLKAVGINRELISDIDDKKILRNILKTHGVRWKGRYLSSENINSLASAFTYTKNVLDESRYNMPIYEECELMPYMIDDILSDWYEARKAGNRMSYEDMQEIIYKKLYVEEDINVIDVIRDSYDFIFLDEFQDTSSIQYEIIKAYADRAKAIVAVGDDDQLIYSWRGSEISIITEKFKKDFQPTVNLLTKNFRCPSNIVNMVRPCIESNKVRNKKVISAANQGGIVYLESLPNYTMMAKRLIESIKEDMAEGISSTVCFRDNSNGLLPAVLLDYDGTIKFSISSKAMTFDSYMGRQVMSIIHLLTDKSGKFVKTALSQLTRYNWEVENLMGVITNSGKSLWELPLEEIKYSCSSFSHILEDWFNAKRTYENDPMGMLEYLLQYYKTFIYNDKGDTFSDYLEKIRAVIDAVIALLQSATFTSPMDFLYEVIDINDRLLARVKAKPKRGEKLVKFVTVHEFKGKEDQHIYGWNVVNGVFPHNRSMDTPKEIEEERRIFYILCTRATQKLTLFKTNQSSLFLEEVDKKYVTIVEKSITGNLSSRGIEMSSEQRNLDKLLKGEL